MTNKDIKKETELLNEKYTEVHEGLGDRLAAKTHQAPISRLAGAGMKALGHPDPDDKGLSNWMFKKGAEFQAAGEEKKTRKQLLSLVRSHVSELENEVNDFASDVMKMGLPEEDVHRFRQEMLDLIDRHFPEV